MNIRFITPRLHGLLDYAAAIALIVLPVVLGLGADSPLALWLSVAGGAGLVAYSLMTDYRFGLTRTITYRTHLLFDFAAAAAFVAAPFVFGWEGLTAIYYVVMGVGVLVVIALSRPEEAPTAIAEAL